MKYSQKSHCVQIELAVFGDASQFCDFIFSEKTRARSYQTRFQARCEWSQRRPRVPMDGLRRVPHPGRWQDGDPFRAGSAGYVQRCHPGLLEPRDRESQAVQNHGGPYRSERNRDWLTVVYRHRFLEAG